MATVIRSPGWAPRAAARCDDDGLAGLGVGVDVAGGAEVLGDVDGEGEVAVALAGGGEVLGADAERRPAGRRERRRPSGAAISRAALVRQRGSGRRARADDGGEEVHPRRADEAGDEAVGGVVVEVERRADLLDAAGAQHDDPVGQRHRLDLVVRDVDHRGAELLVQRARSRRASGPAARRRGWRAARRTGTPAARARWRGRWRRAGAGRRRAGAAGGPSAASMRRIRGGLARPGGRCRPWRCRSSAGRRRGSRSTVMCG